MAATDTHPIQPEWLQPSRRYGWSAAIRNVIPLFLLYTLLPTLADIAPWLPWLLCPLLGLLIYRVSLVMHDCVHLTLLPDHTTNNRMGLILGAIIGVDFKEFSKQHRLHHQCYGAAHDPQGFHYLGLAALSRHALIWHYSKGLLGFNLRHTMHESIIAPHNLKRLIANGDIVIVMAIQALILLLVTGLLTHIVTGFSLPHLLSHLHLALIPFVSAATFGLWLSQLRGMAEHGVWGNTPQLGYVRSHAPYWLDSLLLHDVHFNYHREHHLYPQCPSVHLPAIHTALQQQALIKDTPASMFTTLSSLYAASESKHG